MTSCGTAYLHANTGAGRADVTKPLLEQTEHTTLYLGSLVANSTCSGTYCLLYVQYSTCIILLLLLSYSVQERAAYQNTYHTSISTSIPTYLPTYLQPSWLPPAYRGNKPSSSLGRACVRLRRVVCPFSVFSTQQELRKWLCLKHIKQ